MAPRGIPARLAWVVDSLAIDPGDHLLEIGCGRGVAVSLICDTLVDGTITALDRSTTAIRAAEQANVDHVRSGKATFLRTELAALDLDRQRFDTVFAANVNLFWVGKATRELTIIERLLTPDGALHLFYGYGKPATGRSDVIDKLTARFTEAGYAIDEVVEPSPASAHVLSVRARPVSHPRTAW